MWSWMWCVTFMIMNDMWPEARLSFVNYVCKLYDIRIIIAKFTIINIGSLSCALRLLFLMRLWLHNISDDGCRRRWNKLKFAYTRDRTLRRIQGTPPLRSSCAKYFDSLAFLNPFLDEYKAYVSFFPCFVFLSFIFLSVKLLKFPFHFLNSCCWEWSFQLCKRNNAGNFYFALPLQIIEWNF